MKREGAGMEAAAGRGRLRKEKNPDHEQERGARAARGGSRAFIRLMVRVV